MSPRDRILGILRVRGSATFKQIALGLNHREDGDAIHFELQRLVAEGMLDVVVTQVTSWKSNPPVAGTRSRYRMAQGGRA